MTSLRAASRLSLRQLPKLKFTDQVSALLDRRINHHGVFRRIDPFYASLAWGRLAVEVDHWRRAGRRPQLWWRDDDAFEPSMQLRRLVECAHEAEVPISLSVIPSLLSPELCTWVNRYPFVTILQHGTDHSDVGTGPGPAQFDQNEPAGAIARRLTDGWSAMSGFQRRVPVYVPPWHALSPNTINAAAMAGLTRISAWGGPSAPGRVDVHVDLMRWRGPPRFAGSLRVLGKLTRELRGRRLQDRWQEPIGILTHHLVHDDAAWRFLALLLHFEPLMCITSWQSADVLFGPDGLHNPENHPSKSTAQFAKPPSGAGCQKREVGDLPEISKIRGILNRIECYRFDKISIIRRILILVISISAAWALRWCLSPLLHDQSPYLTFALASLIAACSQGLAAGLATTFIGGLIANYSFVGPPDMLDFGGIHKWSFVIFLAMTLSAIILVCERIQKSKNRGS